MDYAKYNRRTRSARWANDYLKRAKTYHSAARAAKLIYAIEAWLNNNAPFAVTSYSE